MAAARRVSQALPDCLTLLRVQPTLGTCGVAAGPDALPGLPQLLAAVPAGICADRYRRDTMLRVAASIGLVAGLTLAAAVYFQASVWVFVVAMGLIGTYKGVNNVGIESIFADSVQTGKRCSLVPFPRIDWPRRRLGNIYGTCAW